MVAGEGDHWYGRVDVDVVGGGGGGTGAVGAAPLFELGFFEQTRLFLIV